MDAIRDFAIILITTNGGPADATKTVPIRLYETAFRFFNLGYAAGIGLTMLVVSILLATAFLETFHLLNSIQGLVIAYLTFNLPFAIWLFKLFLLSSQLRWKKPPALTGPVGREPFFISRFPS
jgi:ABC-type glycerol-3-phosphate transport system permease component